jgi:hypothetical protein
MQPINAGMEVGMRSIASRWIGLSIAVALTACGDDPFSPTVENVSGSYTASTFTITTAGSTTNLLIGGSTVTVTLAADGSTTGRLFVPGGSENGGDIDADLAGTWTLTGSTVTFGQSSDTFIRDIPFTAGRNRLTADGTFSGATIHLVLTKPG